MCGRLTKSPANACIEIPDWRRVMLQDITIVLGVVVILIIVGFNIAGPIWFHFSTRNLPQPPVEPKPEPKPAKLIAKKDAWADQPSYDYERTSMMAEPVAPIKP